VSDMATYNGYTYFFLDTPKYGPRGVVERQKRQTHVRYIRCRVGGSRGPNSRSHAPGHHAQLRQLPAVPAAGPACVRGRPAAGLAERLVSES
jgi:hypothetical protein